MIQFYRGLVWAGDQFSHFLLLLIRLYWGITLCMAGWGKFVNHTHVAEYFQGLNIPFPSLNAYAAASTEFIGGACLALGLASRLASLPVIFTMVVAYLTTQLDSVKTLFSNPGDFVSQAPFNFLLAALIVFSFGPGAFSIDAIIKRFFFKKKS